MPDPAEESEQAPEKPKEEAAAAESKPEEQESKPAAPPDAGETKPEEVQAPAPETKEAPVESKSAEIKSTAPEIKPTESKPTAPSKLETKASETPSKGTAKGVPTKESEKDALSKSSERKSASARRSTNRQGSLSSLSRRLVPITSIQIMDAGLNQEIFKVKVRKFMPTYRLDSQKPFNSEKAMKIATTVVDDVLKEATYDVKDCIGYIKVIGREIRKRLRRENYDRYRLIVFVLIGQKKMQGIQCRSYAIWDAERDSQCNYLFENMSMFCAVAVYGVYQD